jgi:hypothetical protein
VKASPAASIPFVDLSGIDAAGIRERSSVIAAWFILGPEVGLQRIRGSVGRKHAVGVANGTDASPGAARRRRDRATR